ncbi:MAG: bifunctional 4'-phosphopantothenoylcysteine decarboxylase/phosphopantothenoylcysteine synthetase, partial [Planctomycetaceae bacterium]|nr:bifunctional 4'-phosphopantothenoylcysteine decarboxylase/phosphopantothenoylcysteine synthetase [Planctomycetaceae bacterium]
MPDPLAEREIVIAVGGGIAAYKAAALTSCLVQRSARVSVVMTKNA